MEYKFNCPYLEMYPPIEVLKPCQASAPITFSEDRKKNKNQNIRGNEKNWVFRMHYYNFVLSVLNIHIVCAFIQA